jgi:hypothetical protein
MSTTSLAIDIDELTARLRTLLPEAYQSSYQELEPVPMRSAGLKYAADGTVAWDEIWGSFCDLAMAGGPPHKGAWLGPGTPDDVEAHAARHEEVVAEICRGITLSTDLPADPSPIPGWVRVTCYGETMSSWLLRAITMENVAVRREGLTLDLPAAPHFRLEKEIKNVITVIAKTSHYWLGHMPRTQKEAIAILFATMDRERPLVEPADAGGWRGVPCPSIRAAVWQMRALVAYNVLSRREETTLFVPVNATTDPAGTAVATALTEVHRLAGASGIALNRSGK